MNRANARSSNGPRPVTVGMSEVRVSRDPGQELVTYALGSCIAVAAHDPARRVAGLIHFQLPRSRQLPERAIANPAMFADTGVPLLFRKLGRLGARPEALVVKVVGGATLNDDRHVFDIGRRNYMTVRKLLWRDAIPIVAEDVGGVRPRTVRLHVGTGRLLVISDGVRSSL